MQSGMVRASLLLLYLATLCAYIQAQTNQRLIAFSDTRQVWMSEEDMLELSARKVHFMDITDYYNVTLNAVPKPAPLPSQPTQKDYLQTVLPLLSTSSMTKFITQLANFTTRYYKSNTGAQAAVWIKSEFQNIASAASRNDITVKLFPHSWVQSSVIATIPGRGPNAAQVVIIGGHEDSIVTPVTGRSPGADDDASGTSTVLEVFRALVQAGYYPDRTVKFMAYSAEEAGLLGSQAIATSFVSQNINVYGVLQLDMTGYGNGPIGLVTDNTDAPLTNFMKILFDTYSDLEWTTTQCGYGCSDHASWNKLGYRACFPFETVFSGSNPYIHTKDDLLSKLMPTRMHQVARVAMSFVVELALRAEE